MATSVPRHSRLSCQAGAVVAVIAASSRLSTAAPGGKGFGSLAWDPRMRLLCHATAHRACCGCNMTRPDAGGLFMVGSAARPRPVVAYVFMHRCRGPGAL